MGLFKPKRPSQYPSTILWFFDQVHVSLTAVTAGTVLATRNGHVAWFSVGALGSSLTAKFIKTFIRDPRPPPAESVPSPVRPKKTYGMPSTHSTALSFYFFYLIPILLAGPPPSPSSPVQYTTFIASLGDTLKHWFYSNGFLGFLTAFCGGGIWSRVRLGYHTPAQVIVGVMLGAVLATGWRETWRGNAWIRGNVQGLIDFVWAEGVSALGKIRAEL